MILLEMIELSLLNYIPLVTNFLLECESETLNVIGGGLGKSLWKGNEWWICDGSIIVFENQWNLSCLIDFVIQISLFYFLHVIACRIICILKFLFLVPFADLKHVIVHCGSKDDLYDSANVYVPEHSVLFIVCFDGFQHMLLLDSLFVCFLESLLWFC